MLRFLSRAFAELQQAASITGEGLLALARDEPGQPLKTQIQTEVTNALTPVSK